MKMKNNSDQTRVLQLLDRIRALDAAAAYTTPESQQLGLLPVHGLILAYLNQCNRPSATPTAVAAYLHATKGTVSQSLRVLVNKGLIRKTPSTHDRRKLYLSLTPAGRRVVARLQDHRAARRVLADWPHEALAALQNALSRLAIAMAQEANVPGFGVCRTCRHYVGNNGKGHCRLLNIELSAQDAASICVEHEAAA